MSAIISAAIEVVTTIKDVIGIAQGVYNDILQPAQDAKSAAGAFIQLGQNNTKSSLAQKGVVITYRLKAYIECLNRFDNFQLTSIGEGTTAILKEDVTIFTQMRDEIKKIKDRNEKESILKRMWSDNGGTLDGYLEKLDHHKHDLMFALALLSEGNNRAAFEPLQVLDRDKESKTFWLRNFGIATSVSVDEFLDHYQQYQKVLHLFPPRNPVPRAFLAAAAALIDKKVVDKGDGKASLSEFVDFLSLWGPLDKSFYNILPVVSGKSDSKLQPWFGLSKDTPNYSCGFFIWSSLSEGVPAFHFRTKAMASTDKAPLTVLQDPNSRVYYIKQDESKKQQFPTFRECVDYIANAKPYPSGFSEGLDPANVATFTETNIVSQTTLDPSFFDDLESEAPSPSQGTASEAVATAPNKPEATGGTDTSMAASTSTNGSNSGSAFGFLGTVASVLQSPVFSENPPPASTAADPDEESGDNQDGVAGSSEPNSPTAAESVKPAAQLQLESLAAELEHHIYDLVKLDLSPVEMALIFFHLESASKAVALSEKQLEEQLAQKQFTASMWLAIQRNK